jgi:hypothetical protein
LKHHADDENPVGDRERAGLHNINAALPQVNRVFREDV